MAQGLPGTAPITGARTRLAGRRRPVILRLPPANPFHPRFKEIVMQFVEAHGARIPMIGLGTMTLKEDVCVQAVKTALQLGYRHIDTAAFYGNEVENGEGLRQSGVKREDVFICTKVRENNLLPENFNKSLDQSLTNLKLPYVDLLLIHWNNKDIPFKTSIGALCQAKKDGKAKHVGVANFTTAMLDEAWAVTLSLIHISE